VALECKSGSILKHDRCTGAQDKMTPPAWKTKAAGVKLVGMRCMWLSSKSYAITALNRVRPSNKSFSRRGLLKFTYIWPSPRLPSPTHARSTVLLHQTRRIGVRCSSEGPQHPNQVWAPLYMELGRATYHLIRRLPIHHIPVPARHYTKTPCRSSFAVCPFAARILIT
jgi:hypothetical protein